MIFPIAWILVLMLGIITVMLIPGEASGSGEITFSGLEEEYEPGDIVSITVSCPEDSKSITFQVKDPNGKIHFVQTVSTDASEKAELRFKLKDKTEENDLAGTWTIIASDENAKASSDFEAVEPDPDITPPDDDDEEKAFLDLYAIYIAGAFLVFIFVNAFILGSVRRKKKQKKPREIKPEKTKVPQKMKILDGEAHLNVATSTLEKDGILTVKAPRIEILPTMTPVQPSPQSPAQPQIAAQQQPPSQISWETTSAKGSTDTATDTNIKILRATENFRGYVRIKAAVVNRSQAVITEVEMDLKFDERTFRLDKIEPMYEIRGNKVKISVVNAGDKKTVAFYLDPQICTTSSIDAVVTYRDSTGMLHTITMRPKGVNVVCPIFFTQDTANTAMLKNLMSNVLKHQDSKLYSTPKGLMPGEAFEIAKSSVSGRSIQFVRDFCQPMPYVAEAWYYGVTKVKKIQTVIKVSVDNDKKTIQIFAATSDEDALTGLLAELGHDLAARLKQKGMPATQVTNVTIKDSVLNRTSLLFDDTGSGGGNISVEGSVILNSTIGGAAGAAMIVCPYCFKKTKPDDNYCIHCGRRIA